MGLKLFQVDAFTEKPFAGNPAAVCLLPEPRGEVWMQQVAREMNLAETAFLCRQEDGFDLRWFTPAAEVDLCGHATLASAHTLWETEELSPAEQARFHTRSGLLTAERRGDWIEMNFPAILNEPATAPLQLSQALEVTPRYLGKAGPNYLIEMDSEETVRNLKPDLALFKTLPVQGVIVTSAAASSKYDFVSRYFAPKVGVDEDPVTGSAHCSLGPFWSQRLGKTEFVAYQASARGGIVGVRLSQDRVYLSGRAVTILRGELTDKCEG